MDNSIPILITGVNYGAKMRIPQNKLLLYKKKAIRLLSFADYQEESSPLFKNLNLLKLTDIVRQNNIIFTHNSINNNTPRIFNDYFNFEESNHQYQTVNSLNSTYSIPAGSLELPTYRTNSGKSSIKYICASTWNSTLKDLSIKYTERYHKDPLWISKTNVQSLRNILKKHFLEYY